MSDRIDNVEQASKIGILWTLVFVGLGVGATIWLGFFITEHQWNRDLAQEKRSAEWVGQKDPPKAPVKITVRNQGCLKVTRAIIDDDQSTIFLQRICGKSGDYAELRWKQKANETVVYTNYTNWGVDGIGKGEQLEFDLRSYEGFELDPRTTEVVLETSSRN